MKVSEAKGKVCPFIEDAIFSDNNGTNGTSEIPKNIRCICSDCMSWQGMKEKKQGTVGCLTCHYEDGKYLEKTDDKSAPYGYCKRLEQCL